MQVLREAARKTAFDDHINDDTRAHLTALEAGSAAAKSADGRIDAAGHDLGGLKKS